MTMVQAAALFGLATEDQEPGPAPTCTGSPTASSGWNGPRTG